MMDLIAKMMGVSGDVSDEKFTGFLKKVLGKNFNSTAEKAIQEAPAYLQQLQIDTSSQKELSMMEWVTILPQRKAPDQPINMKSFINLCRVFGCLAADNESTVDKIVPIVKKYLSENHLEEPLKEAIKQDTHNSLILKRF